MPVLRQSRGQPAPDCRFLRAGLGAHAWTFHGVPTHRLATCNPDFWKTSAALGSVGRDRRRPAPGGSHVAIQERAVHREALVPVPVGSSRRHAPSNWLLPVGLRPACCRVGSRRIRGAAAASTYGLCGTCRWARRRVWTRHPIIATQCTFRYRCCRKNSTIAAEASGPAGSV